MGRKTLATKRIQHPISNKYVNVTKYSSNFAMKTNNEIILVPMMYIMDWNENTKLVSSKDEFTERQNDDKEAYPLLLQFVR